MTVNVIFFPVKDAQEKIQLICHRAQEALRQEKRLLIAVPNDEAAQYVDALLWKQPEESFIPHLITQAPTKVWVALTTKLTHNFNQANALLNLYSSVHPLYQQFEVVYELDDQTHPQKIELSKQRRAFYETNGVEPVFSN